MMMSVQRDSREIEHAQPARLTRTLRQQQADWFRTDFHWDIFATLTFSHYLTSGRANAVLGRYLRLIEEEVRAPLSCLIAEELGPSVPGKDTGRVHFHLLIHCAKPLDLFRLAEVWREDHFGGVRVVGETAEVRRYVREISAAFYMLKGLRDPKWGWSEWRLEGASKRKPERTATSKEPRRMWKRQQERGRRYAVEMKAEEERQAIAQHTSKAILQNPKALELILTNAQVKLESIAGSKIGYDPLINVKAAEVIFEKIEAKTETAELMTGNPVFDEIMGGIPIEGVMVSMPGKPHHGKSIFLDNLIVGMLDRNPDLQVFLHHVDDVALMRIPRILGVMSGLSSRDISNAGASFLTGGTEFRERYEEARKKFMGWIRDERLILADQSVLVGDLTAHERWIREIRRRNSKGQFLSIGDNFHLFDMPGMDPGEGKVREMSKFIAGLPARHGITTMFSMELPKDVLKPGTRPKYTDSKNSGGIAFDSKVNMNVYQELQDLGEESELVWRSPDHLEQVTTPTGTVQMVEKKMPIVEVIVDKNKFSGVKKTVFFRLEPMSGRMEECSASEQSVLAAQLVASQNARRQARTSFAEHKRGF